jgi:hypothetical protein
VDLPGPAYQKDDFFDHIGCEALERLTLSGNPGAARSRFAEQRKVSASVPRLAGMAEPSKLWHMREGKGGR